MLQKLPKGRGQEVRLDNVSVAELCSLPEEQGSDLKLFCPRIIFTASMSSIVL